MTETPTDMIARLTGFTPGPWQINGSHIYGPDPDRTVIAQVLAPGWAAWVKAAALIAAAPDMHRELAAALSREAGLRTALDAILEHCRNDGIEPSTVAERVLERVEDTALAALAVKP